MRALSLLVVFGLVGCGARVIDGRHVAANPDDASTTDSVVTIDTATIDTAVLDDSSVSIDVEPIDTSPPLCDTPVSGFSCPTVSAKGAKVCNDMQIRAFMDACFGDTGDPSACSNAQSKYASCAKCVLETFITPGGYLDVGACIKKVKPASPCASSVNCLYACWADACSSCDFTITGGTSDYNECLIRQSDPTGSCYDFGAKDYDSCTSDPDLTVCVPATIDALLPFYRGGCRDGGDWSKAEKPDGT
jgi:hypothetical protein